MQPPALSSTGGEGLLSEEESKRNQGYSFFCLLNLQLKPDQFSFSFSFSFIRFLDTVDEGKADR